MGAARGMPEVEAARNKTIIFLRTSYRGAIKATRVLDGFTVFG
jgi:hypothetical protein